MQSVSNLPIQPPLLPRPSLARLAPRNAIPYCGSCNKPVSKRWYCAVCHDRCDCGRLSPKGEFCERCWNLCERHKRFLLRPFGAANRDRHRSQGMTPAEGRSVDGSTGASSSHPCYWTPNVLTYCEDCDREQFTVGGDAFAVSSMTAPMSRLLPPPPGQCEDPMLRLPLPPSGQGDDSMLFGNTIDPIQLYERDFQRR